MKMERTVILMSGCKIPKEDVGTKTVYGATGEG